MSLHFKLLPVKLKLQDLISFDLCTSVRFEPDYHGPSPSLCTVLEERREVRHYRWSQIVTTSKSDVESTMAKAIMRVGTIQQRILLIRGEKVMVDERVGPG